MLNDAYTLDYKQRDHEKYENILVPKMKKHKCDWGLELILYIDSGPAGFAVPHIPGVPPLGLLPMPGVPPL